MRLTIIEVIPGKAAEGQYKEQPPKALVLFPVNVYPATSLVPSPVSLELKGKAIETVKGAGNYDCEFGGAIQAQVKDGFDGGAARSVSALVIRSITAANPVK